MTSLQASETSALGISGEEDPMELSMDFEKRFLGEEDIDIDLGLGGKSPYNQEDDYMLEDTTFMEVHSGNNGRPDGNDDEMADEVGTPQPMADAPEVYAESDFDDTTGFDILVDDEDLLDADETMSQSGIVGNHAEQDLDSHNVSSSQQPEDLEGHFFEGDDYSLFQPLEDDRDVFQPVHDALLTTNNSDADEEDLSFNAQDTKPPVNPYSSSSQNADANNSDLPQGSRIELLSGLDHRDESSSAVKATIEKDSTIKNKDEEKNSGSASGHKPARSDTDRTPRAKTSSFEAPEHQGLENNDNLGNLSHSVLEDRNAIRHSPDTDPAKDLSGIDNSDRDGKDQHDDLAYNTKNHHPINLHPVIVVYQDNEISLFPPHEETEKHSATYFLQDETIANGSIRALLGACRVVLADSIGEHDELEIKIVPLGIDISETCSEASTFSLLQIMNLYLQLQHNDGIHYPDPLHVILTTKLSLPYRLQYLHNAVEEGLGFLDIVLPSSVEVIEARAETDDEQSQETEESTNEEHEQLVGQGSILADVHDESDKMAGSLDRLLDDRKNAQNIEIKTRDENPTITQDNSDNYGQDQHSNARNYDSEEVPTSFSIYSKAVKQVERRIDHILATTLTNTSHSGHAAEAQILGVLSNETLHNGDVDYEGQEKEPQVSSAASSTLRGDTSDVAPGEAQADSLTITSQDERQSREASHEGDDHENFVAIVTNIPNGIPHLNTGSMNQTAALNRRSNSPSILASQRKTSASVSDIDNNEITYEDEDGDEDEEENEDENQNEDPNDDDDDDYGGADDNEDILTTGSHSIQDIHSLPATPLSQHDSLKRAREEEDDDSSPEVDLQAEMKRVRST
ncbi:hypothetical protein MMC17_002869 [Xylographa soralifera]|nr:hypothetical protein [Xylographa soralifera]